MAESKIYFPEGTFVKITKTNIAPGQESRVNVGTVMIGQIEQDLKEGNCVRIAQGGNTSPVQKIIETESNDLILETETSTYLLQAIV